MLRDTLVKQASATIPIHDHQFNISIFQADNSTDETVVLSLGLLQHNKAPLVRLHSECLTGDIFNSQKCDCGWQLNFAIEQIIAEGCGVIIYLRQEGRGIGLIEKIKAYALQDKGYNTIEANEKLGHAADLRDYGIAIKILKYLNLSSVRLLSNNPEKIKALEEANITCQRAEIIPKPGVQNIEYLQIKQLQMNHLLDLPGLT